MIKVGLTGNFGMGKSTVAELFRKLGAYVIDADKIVNELLTTSSIKEEIEKLFGKEAVKNGKVDKKFIADIVFENPFMRIYLENILHPKVFERIEEEIKKIPLNGEPKIVVIEAPLIFERGYQNRFDFIVTVYTSEEIAIERLKQKGISEKEIKRRFKSQFPIEMKKSKSDFIIDNSKSIEETKAQVEEIFQKLITLERKYAGN